MTSSLILNHQRYSRAELLDYCAWQLQEKAQTEFETSIYRFIQQWLDNSDSLTVTTSGTTGKAKSYQVSKDKMRASAAMTIQYFNLTPASTALLCLSPQYIAGKMMLVRAFESGMDLLTSSPSSPLSGSPLLASQASIDFAAMVPTQLYKLLRQPEQRQRLNKFKQLLLGGAALSASQEQQLQGMSCQCYASFGMTETLSHIALRRVNGAKAQADYQPLKGVNISQDPRGCLCIDAPHLCAERIISNDLVSINNNGFQLLGRYDNLINSGGVKLSPEVLEKRIAHLFSQPFVLTGVVDEKLGQKLVLVIEAKANKVNPQQLLQQSQQILTGFAKPKAVYLLDTLPTNANGKLLRRQLSQQLAYQQPC